METVGKEVIFKIKSAVKAKLQEIGAYVDEELPDYIMVMISNRRSKAQMNNDLSLFLGNHTELFTEWLHNVLQKLEAFGVSKDTPKIADGVPLQEKDESQTTRKGGQVYDKLDLADEKKQKSSSAFLVQDELLKSVSKMNVSTQPDLVSRNEPEKVETSGKSHVSRSRHNTDPLEETQNDYLNIQDEGDHDFQQEDPSPAKKSNSILLRKDTYLENKKRRIALQDERKVKKTRQEEVSRQQRLGSVVHPMNPVSRHTNSSNESRKPRNISEDEESDRKGGVPSVVYVTDRPRLPARMQATKSLVLKAMADAQKSVALNPPRIYEPEKKDKPTVELFTRKYRQKNENVVHQPASVSFPNVPETSMEVDTVVQVQEEMEPADSFVEQIYDTAEEVSNAVQTRFIVTLDGFHMNLKKNYNGDLEEEHEDEALQSSIVRTQGSNVKSRLYRRRSTGSEVAGQQATLERCKYWPSCRLGERCTFHHPSLPCKTFPNCTFGDNCLFVHPNCKFDVACTRKNCPYNHSDKTKVPAPVAAAVVPSKPPPVVAVNGKTICKYFPQCNNVSCSYFHPLACKFGTNCTRAGCTFYHPKMAALTKLKWVASK